MVYVGYAVTSKPNKSVSIIKQAINEPNWYFCIDILPKLVEDNNEIIQKVEG